MKGQKCARLSLCFSYSFLFPILSSGRAAAYGLGGGGGICSIWPRYGMVWYGSIWPRWSREPGHPEAGEARA